MSQELTPNHANNEIDLFELIETLWREKLWIIAFACIAAIGGGSYAFLSTPTYKAEVRLLPPSSRDVAELNQLSNISFSSNTNTNANAITPESAYNNFIQVLNSSTLRKSFYSEADIRGFFNPNSLPATEIWNKYNKSIVIDKPNKKTSHTRLSISISNPEKAAEFANRYIELALKATTDSLISDFQENLRQSKNKASAAIHSKESVFLSRMQLELTKLYEAKAIAEKIGIEHPRDTSQLSNKGLMVDELRRLYSSGTIAINAEIEVLETRIKNNHHTQDLAALKEKLAFLNTITLNETNIKPAIVDLEALIPINPIKPNKKLIILLSILLGSALGIFFILIRTPMREQNHSKLTINR